MMATSDKSIITFWKGGRGMGKVTLDPDLRARMNNFDHELELCDENGRTLGRFLPEDVYRKLLYASIKVPFTEEEIEQARKQKGTGCSLQEFWKRLGQA
jgi:hypothetical protein